MLCKQILAIAASILLCMTTSLGLAKERTYDRDSIKTVILKRPAPLSRIDTISLSAHERELASSPIREIIKDQFSPLKKQMEEDHNADVEAYVNKYTNQAFRAHLSKMKGLAAYYFPIFEQIFGETGVPQAIKYLAIIESSLNPHAVSRVGATGPWQFMYTTAKGYGLKMNSYVDERKDPFEATYAAANYLKESFNIYGDWLLAIASYNCGPGNVNRAISRSGKANPTFWDIQRYLPAETRNYIPAFIAMAYVMENTDLYPVEANYTDMPTDIDVILVDKNLSLSSIAKVLEIEPEELYRLNPSYKRKIIQGDKLNPSRLIVPKVQSQEYAKLYSFLQGNSPATPAILEAQNQDVYIVKKGDTLDGITKRFKGSTVSSLKAMNNLRSNVIQPGMTLKVNQD
ncbi:membrane-bound lytic murein transglycosylase D [Albibacterium bauzanense]|uniref:Membrane-bound lytic murein transglycosylase D n=2 Tax=Albibacterium bauzanense TaxID=653929 RepID=A0A4R1LW96_9SPHI|nr:membrane-bound lytic murein transglycosylase D [Albibacterium bauzanense]